jgi:hypothetical protein
MEELNQFEIDEVSGAGLGLISGMVSFTKFAIKSLYVEAQYFDSIGRLGDFNEALIGGNLGA